MSDSMLKTNSCTFSSDFWLLFQAYFARIHFLNIIILQDGQYQNEVSELSVSIIRELSTLNHSFKVQEKRLSDNASTHNFNVKDGYFICVSNIETLETFLETDYRLVLPNPTSIYTILIIFHTDKCDTVHHDFNQILNQLWLKYHVAKITIQTPCSCDSTKVYVYRPFDVTNNTQSYSLNEVLNNPDLISTRQLNMNQFPLPVSLFIREPSVVKQLPSYVQTNPIYSDLTPSKGYAGVDALILGALAQKLNFSPIIVENWDDEPFGRVLPNGTAIATLGDIVTQKVQLSSNARFLKDYNTEEIEFTIPYSSDQICMVVPKASRIPVWRKLLNCFTAWSWMLILLSCVAYTIVWYFVGPYTNFVQSMSQVFAFMVGIPKRVSPSNTQFVFLAFCFFFNVIIFGIIQGSFVTEYTTTTFYKDIDTLEELYESNLPIATDFWFLVEDDNSDVTTRLRQHAVPVTEDSFDQTAFKGNVGTISRKQDMDFLLKTVYKSKDGFPLVHNVKECFSTILLANIVPKGSPYLDAINEVMLRLFEAGFTTKWDNDVIEGFEIENLKNFQKQGHSLSATLYDMQIGFRLLVIGYFVSILVYVGEVLIKYKCGNKH
ncbi:hypothetical protein Zmor_019379 [Zophobas morio]|uniref:Ionotropic glutamate receptor C-terminal domain-containing protein n=1 Tax=Zophobas morio TaxID=2755281 RepID=A0AA38I1K3_9CUCU|nr:hypothetical protein Zmor_019379 [Zophobas morio]